MMMFSFIKKVIRGERYYTIAIKKDNLIFGIPFSEYEWYADPLAIKHNNGWYVFMEIFDKKEGKGHIGVSEIRKDYTFTSPQKIISEMWHMSFPFCFKLDGNYYMIPETSGSGKLWLYKCIKFPYEWKIVDSIENRERQVDSIVINVENRLYMISSDVKKDNPYMTRQKIERLLIQSDHMRLIQSDIRFKETTSYNLYSRNGGLYEENGVYKRVIQESEQGCYGVSCEICKINIADGILMENIDKKVDVNTVINNSIWNSKIYSKSNLIGIHTYQVLDGFELFDLSFWHFSIIELLFRIRNKFILCTKR